MNVIFQKKNKKKTESDFTIVISLTRSGADVLVLAAGGRGRAARGGDGEHRGSGVLRCRQVRGLPQGNAQHGFQDTQEKHTAVHRKLQGEGDMEIEEV